MFLVFLSTIIILAYLSFVVFTANPARGTRASYVMTGIVGCAYSLVASVAMVGSSPPAVRYGNSVNPAKELMSVFVVVMIIGIVALSIRAFFLAADAE
jgi:hypothetical protein